MKRGRLKYNNELIYIKRAPEPEDIIWKNLHVPLSKRIYGICIAWILTLLLLAVCFLVNYLIYRASNFFSIQTDQTFLSFLISILASILIVIVNLLIKFLIPYFTETFEKRYTFTKLDNSISIKLAISYFINSAIIPLISQGGVYFRNGGLLFSVWLNWILFAIGMPILETLNLRYIIYLIRRWSIRRDDQKSSLTQIEAKKMFENELF